MTEETLYEGSEQDAILDVLRHVTKQAFEGYLMEEPTFEVVPVELKLEEFCDIGDGYKSSGRSFAGAMVSVASTAYARSKKGKQKWASWTMANLKFANEPHDLKVVFQGGFVTDTVFAFNAISMGSILDFMIPRGFGTTIVNGKPAFVRGSVAGDTEGSPSGSPFISLYETQSMYAESKINQLISQIPPYTTFSTRGRFGGTTYASAIAPMLMMSPRQGRTIMSIQLSPYGDKSETAAFRMPGEKSAWTLEVAVPSPHNLRQARLVMEEAINVPGETLVTHEVTGEIVGGVDALLALEVARERYRPDSDPFGMTDVVRSGPVVQEVLNQLRSEYPMYEMNVYEQLKGNCLKKV